MTECPSLAQWQAVLTQGVSGPEEEAFSEHAQACATCQAVLEKLSQPEGLPSAWLNQAVLDTPLPVQASTDTPPQSLPQDPYGTVDFQHPAAPADRGPLVPGYEILEELGRGGMGVVFKARHLELNRLVALKMLRDGALADTEALARFRDEARAVARLQHPGIVQIHEIGTLEGQPYLALEYVPGRSLERHLQGTPQPPHDAATLLIPLAQAIHAAHLQGIIHRDLKPANILLGEISGQKSEVRTGSKDGMVRLNSELCSLTSPKITDFGLAKPLDGDSSRTETGVVAGTPCYMAPEQASGQKQLGPAVDIYALGAILYEMLTGRPPFKGVTAYDTIHLVRTEEPVPPRRLQPQVPRDLETICLKCLRKEPARRYLTAQEVADDVQRFLDGRPILARPTGRTERAVKWCRRYPAVAALLVVSTVAAVWALLSAEGERRARLDAQANEQTARQATDAERAAKLQAEKDRDDKEAARLEEERQRKFAQAIAAFVRDDFLALTTVLGQDSFGIADTEALDGRSTLRQLLDRAAGKLRVRKDLDPQIEAELCWIVGVNYRVSEEPRLAVPFLERTVRLRSDLLGRDHEDTLNAMNSLALAYFESGQLDPGERLMKETVQRKMTKDGPYHYRTLQCMSNLAGCYARAGKLDQALQLYEQTLAQSKASLGPNHDVTQRCMQKLGHFHCHTGKPNLGLPLLLEALALCKAEHGPDHRRTLLCMFSLAFFSHKAGKRDQALPLLLEALPLMKARLGPDDPFTLRTMNALAEVYVNSGKSDQALPLLVEGLALRKARLGLDHSDTLQSMNNLATVYWSLGQDNNALPLFEEALALKKIKFGPDHPDTLLTMNNLAAGYRSAGKLDQALPLMVETLTRRKAKLGHDHPDTLESMANLASLYWSLKRLDKSVPLFEETLRRSENKLGRNHPDTLRVVANLGVNYRDAGRLQEAIPLLEEAYRASKEHPWLQFVGSQLQDAYTQAREKAKLSKLLEELLSEIRRTLPKDSPQLANMLALLGLNLVEREKWAEAEPLLRESLAIREKAQPDAWTTFHTRSLLGAALLGQKKYAEAEPLLRAGYEGMKQRVKTVPPRSGPHLLEALDFLIEFYAATNQPNQVKHWQAERAKYPSAAPAREQK